MKKPSYDFPRYIFWGVLGIFFSVSVFLLGYFLVIQHHTAARELQKLQSEIFTELQENIKSEAETVAANLLFAQQQAESLLKNRLKEYVRSSIDVIRSLHQQNHEKLSEPDLKNLIKESLRNLRFFDGRGYLFIDDIEGNVVLFPTSPEYEGHSLLNNPNDDGQYIVKGFVEMVKQRGGGFSRYRWYSPDSSPGNAQEITEKLTYVEAFEPFNWIVGTGDYLHFVEQELQKLELERITNQRFGANGYIAIVASDGTLIESLGAPHLEGLHLSDMPIANANAIDSIVKKGQQGGGFIEYDWYLPNGQIGHKKMSYIKPFNHWGWNIVVGFYPEDLEETIATRQEKLDRHLHHQIRRLVIVFLCVGALGFLMIVLFSQWIQRRFSTYQLEIESKQETLNKKNRSLELSARVVASAVEGIQVTDADSRIVEVNDAFTIITGYSQSEVIGQHPRMLSSNVHDSAFFQQIQHELYQNDSWQGEVWSRRKNGDVYPQWLSLTLSKDASGNVLNHIATFTDISERKKFEEQLKYLANYDSLTDLPNRRMLSERLSYHLAEEQQQTNAPLMVIFMDLNGFKNINDTLGHAAGDAVLVEVAERLKRCVDDKDNLSRVGGDEFVLLVRPQHANPTEPKTDYPELIQEAFKKPFYYLNEEIIISISVGIACAPEHGDTPAALLKNADIALYHAKREGANKLKFYSHAMNDRFIMKKELEDRIRAGLCDNEFTLHYQPQLDLGTNRISSVEALIRWPQPDGNFISPDKFIPVAEESGLIFELGSWVIHQACKDAVKWQERGTPLAVAVNISTRQLAHSNLPQVIKEVLENTGLRPQSLMIEITETALMDNIEIAEKILNRIKMMGIGVSLDDFGTGCSSLTFLKQFPVDELKVDRSFVDGLPDDNDDKAITSSLIYAAHRMGISVVAEGIETREQQDYLKDLNCDKGQGYLFSKAIPAIEIEALVQKQEQY